MPAQIDWTPDLSVGVEAIDAQHREWLARYNALAEALGRREGPARLGELLGFLIDYTVQHFGAEKAVMALHAYPELEGHSAKHAAFRETLADLVREYEEEGATHVLADALEHTLSAWLVDHIRTVDVALGRWLQARGLQPQLD